VNLYGATKLCSDKLFVAANGTARHDTRFSVVRYGNVVGSRGSVIPYFLAQRETGRLTITDERMTRFLITLAQAVDFVLRALQLMLGGEILVPKMPSARVLDLAKAIGPDCKRDVIGIRPGEKLHETLVPEDDARMALEFPQHYCIQPSHSFWNRHDFVRGSEGKRCPDGFSYTSDRNPHWLTPEQIKSLVSEVEAGTAFQAPPTPGEPSFIVGG
jgi:UDP-N-acetylglucosamine 4,6-dehydratase